MRLGIIADVHGNIFALRRALEMLVRDGVEEIVCAGDIVGYGAHPNECTELVRRSCAFAVRGNHEEAVLSRDARRMNPYAGAAARWTWEHITPENLGFLGELEPGASFGHAGRTVAMFHGSVGSVDQYIFEEEVTEALLQEAHASLLILGHTHCPYIRRFASGTVVNPGSVGQPRDGNPKGSYALWDPEEGARIRRFEYDIDSAAEAIIAAGLPRVLADRLYLGR